jgi:serine/threonine protein kinase
MSLAEQATLGLQVALKVMSPSLIASDSGFRDRFLYEGRSVAKLQHRNIVTIYDIGYADGRDCFISMEYCPGGTLKDWIREGTPTLPALQVVRQIASALSVAHQHGIIHRDIRPSNILFRHDGTALLSDFSFATVFNAETRLTSTGWFVGKAEYMSPEQARGAALSPSSDLYSLGVVLYEMVTGQTPFAGSDPFAIAMQHAAAPIPQLPSELHWLQHLLDGLLAKQADDRFGSADELIAEIDALERLSPVLSDEDTTGFGRRIESKVLPPLQEVGHRSPALTEKALPKRLLAQLGGRAAWRAYRNAQVQLARENALAVAEEKELRELRVSVSSVRHDRELDVSQSSAPRSISGLSTFVRYTLLVGGLLLLGWLGLEAIPLIFGSIRSSDSRRPNNETGDLSPVECSIFAPPTLPTHREILVQVFLHPPGRAEDAETGATQFDADAEWRGFSSLSLDLAPGTRVAVELDVEDLTVSDEGCGEIRWNGGVVGTSFWVSAGRDVALGRRRATARFLVDGVPAGRIHFVIEVVASQQAEASPEALGDASHRYRKAFISYASEDRTEVLKRVQTLGALRIDFFQDALNLEPGERWEKALYREIDGCDLFLLFWSSSSVTSDWVRKEARYALERQTTSVRGEPDIIPVMIEGPPPPTPWPELAHLHFNDKLLYLMRCEESRSG